MKRRPPSPAQASAATADKPMFVTWAEGDDRGRALAFHEASRAVAKYQPVVRTQASSLWKNVAPNSVSVRDGFGRDDFDYFRPEDALPSGPKEEMVDCMRAYKRVGVIRNVIDLMADFGAQGVDLVHPNERVERFFKEWFRRVGGKERSERFLNILYRTGNVIVQRQTARLPVAVERQMRKAADAPDLVVQAPPKTVAREIPWQYVFRNPVTTDVMGDELALFVGQKAFVYAIPIPRTLAGRVKFPKTDVDRGLVAKLPAAVVQAIKGGATHLPLPPDKTRSFFYKRDDWEVWSSPMVSAVLPDLQMLEKMKLADLAALDGAVSCIRVWKLGDVKNRILPTEAAISRLAEMLCNNVGGGVMDLVWGPEIDLLETKTDVHHFLGDTKYGPVLTAIYAGLGIPPTLTGAPGGGGGFTNNFVSLKTLTERLQYGRDQLAAFWAEEIRLVQQAMGFRFPATLKFDRMVLTDESAEKQLLINLADRDLISVQTLQERFGEDPDIEAVRVRREYRGRDKGLVPAKAGPFHSPEKEHDLKKLFAQSGAYSPSQLGVELDDGKKGEKPPAEIQSDLAPEPAPVAPGGGGKTKPKGQPGQGRPKNKKDSQKRKQKQVKPRSRAAFLTALAWAEDAQSAVAKVTAPAYLKSLGKNSLRELTSEQARAFEGFKFSVLCHLAPGKPVDRRAVAAASRGDLSLPAPVVHLLKATVAKHVAQHGREPTAEAVRRYQAGAFALWAGEFPHAE